MIQPVMILSEPKWIVFDLGGVLAEYVGSARMLSWMRDPPDMGEMYRRWLFSPTVRAFESGKIELLEFAQRIIDELGLDVRKEDFLHEFPRFVTGYFPGAEALLQALSRRYQLAMLSNTNAPQWAELCRTSAVEKYFGHVFLSFRMGLLKPDLEIFRHVVHTLGCEPGEIVFFDDNAHNVQGAKDCGIRAVQVAGFEDMRAIIMDMDLLPGTQA